MDHKDRRARRALCIVHVCRDLVYRLRACRFDNFASRYL